MAFTPTAPPPSPQHLAQIAEALCARAEARERAAVAAARKRHTLWKRELSTLRNIAPAAKVTTNTTGAAAVLQARLARIVPQVKTQTKPQTPVTAQPSQERIDAYNARMARYFTPIAAPATTTAPSAPNVSVRAVPKPKPTPPPQRTIPRRPVRVMEPVLAAAPIRPAIQGTLVKPMLEGVKQSVQAVEEEQVQRPSLIDAIVNAFHNFMDGMRKKTEHEQKKTKEAEAVAVGAAAQALAVFISLGKH